MHLRRLLRGALLQFFGVIGATGLRETPLGDAKNRAVVPGRVELVPWVALVRSTQGPVSVVASLRTGQSSV